MFSFFRKRNNSDVAKSNNDNSKIVLTNFYSLVDSANVGIDLLKSTKNIDTFFSNYHHVLDCFKNMDEMVTKYSINVKNGSIYSHKNKFLDEYEDYKYNFLDRYYEKYDMKLRSLKTEKAKRNNFNIFLQEISEYSSEFSAKDKMRIDIFKRALEEKTK